MPLLKFLLAGMAAALVAEVVCGDTVSADNAVWTAQTIKSAKTVDLTQDIVVQGLITIESGGSLTINIAEDVDRDVTIKATKASSSAADFYGMFKCIGTGCLYISGKESGGVTNRVVIDGGANYPDPTLDDRGRLVGVENVDFTDGAKSVPGISLYDAALQNMGNGTMSLRHVVIRNVMNKTHRSTLKGTAPDLDNEGGAIRHGKKGADTSGGTRGKTLLDDCLIERCMAYIGGALFLNYYDKGDVVISNSVIRHCVSYATHDNKQAGVIRSVGKTQSRLTLVNTRITGNYSRLCGGAIQWNALGSSASDSFCRLEDCEISANRSMTSGGGISCSGYLECVGQTRIFDNVAVDRGGGISFEVYDDDNAVSQLKHVIQVELGEGISVSSNSASAGGGISFAYEGKCSFKSGSSCTLKVNSASFVGNEAAAEGGAILSVQTKRDIPFAVDIQGATIRDNAAGVAGGGVFARGLDRFSFESGQVEANRANDGGGFCFTNCTLTISGGNVVSNVAANAGGGVCALSGAKVIITNGTDSASGLAVISCNVATNFGGGVALRKNAVMEISEGRVEDNRARMGGGVYLSAGARLTVGAGDICSNKAVAEWAGAADDDDDENSAAGTGDGDMRRGVGGGVYVGKGEKEAARTTFACPGLDGREVGVYNNEADRAGDDIVSSGVYTRLDLPDRTMTNGYYRLYWFEDYYQDDQSYPNLTGSGDLQNILRYKSALAAGCQVIVTNATAATGKLVVEEDDTYACLALGYTFSGTIAQFWISDIADAGPGKIGFRFAPVFSRQPDTSLDIWTRQMLYEERLRAQWSPDATAFPSDPSSYSKLSVMEGRATDPSEGLSPWLCADLPADCQASYCRLVVDDSNVRKRPSVRVTSVVQSPDDQSLAVTLAFADLSAGQSLYIVEGDENKGDSTNGWKSVTHANITGATLLGGTWVLPPVADITGVVRALVTDPANGDVLIAKSSAVVWGEGSELVASTFDQTAFSVSTNAAGIRVFGRMAAIGTGETELSVEWGTSSSELDTVVPLSSTAVPGSDAFEFTAEVAVPAGMPVYYRLKSSNGDPAGRRRVTDESTVFTITR